MVAITRPASSCYWPTCASIRTILSVASSKFPPPMWPTALIRPSCSTFLTVADPAPERVVPWIVGVPSQLSSPIGQPSSVRTVRRRYRRTASGDDVTFSRGTSSCTKVFTLCPHFAERECDARTETQKEAEFKLQQRAGAIASERASRPDVLVAVMRRLRSTARCGSGALRYIGCVHAPPLATTCLLRGWVHASVEASTPALS